MNDKRQACKKYQNVTQSINQDELKINLARKHLTCACKSIHISSQFSQRCDASPIFNFIHSESESNHFLAFITRDNHKLCKFKNVLKKIIDHAIYI